MQDLGVFHSLGALWIRVLNELETKGAEAVYTDNAGESAEVKELLYLTAYCRALDFGCKAYVNLVMLYLIQKEIAEKAGIPCGKLILIVKSAHFYLRDREKVLAIIDKER